MKNIKNSLHVNQTKSVNDKILINKLIGQLQVCNN